MRRDISVWRAVGTPPAWSFSALASGLGKVGRPQEGLEVVEEGFASIAKTGEHC
jgi:pentatricopeptide repeat protein